jgi:DNA polymerase-4
LPNRRRFDSGFCAADSFCVPLRSVVIDYNSFFASCEQQERPELRDRPVAVAPTAAETTCCIAASYDAKQRGIKVGTRVDEARRLCPGLVLLEARPEIYVRYHDRLIATVEQCIPVTEVLSIDEMWCELPPSWRTRERVVALARQIKRTIARDVGACLTSSIGAAPNPWLAKIASDLRKPDGLVLLDETNLPQALFALQLRDLPGVGAHMEARLRAAGLDSVEQLYAASCATLRRVWSGIEGERMWRRLRGEMVELPPRRTGTIGHSHVLPPELRTEAGALATLHRLLQKAAMRLRHAGFYAGGLHVGLRYGSRERWSTAATFLDTQDTLELIRVFTQLWARRPRECAKIFSVGVTLFDFTPAAAHTGTLPGIVDNGDRRAALNATLDHINRKLGKNTVVFGGALGALHYAPIRIAFNRIPDVALEEGEADGELFPTAAELAKFRRQPRATASPAPAILSVPSVPSPKPPSHGIAPPR